MEMLQKLTELKAKTSEIAAMLVRMIADLTAAQTPRTDSSSPTVKRFETVCELTASAQFFKGTHPTGLIFPDGRRVNVSTWKALVTELMKDCLKNENYKRTLFELRGLLAGRSRKFLDATDENMGNSIKLDENLYMECQYDTESLLRIVLHKILDQVEYDYSGVKVAILNKK